MTLPVLSPETLIIVLADLVLEDAPSSAVASLAHPSLTAGQIADVWCEYKDALNAIDALADGSAHPEDYIGSTAAPGNLFSDDRVQAAIGLKRMEAGAALRLLLHGSAA